MNITFIAGIAEKLRAWLTGWFGAILSLIPKTIYALCTFIFSIMDILQVLVRKVAGLDQVYYTAQDWALSEPQTGDIAYNFIQHIFLGKTPILSNVFWAMIILGVILLFLTTLIAVLRSEYAATDAKSASKGRIIGQAFKAIASFAIVPIVAFFGMYLANVILQAIDSVTTGPESEIPIANGESLFERDDTTKTYATYCFYYDNIVPTTSTPISGQIFTASAYKANRIRFYTLFRNNITNEDVGAGVFNLLAANPEEAANLLDNCFSNTYVLKTERTLTTEPFKDDYLYSMGSGASFFSNSPVTFKTFDKNNVALVWYYYDLWSFDFIICIAALVVAGKILVDLVFGLMKRIFELIILFLIAAPISSLMPLDNGAALGNWRKKFIAKAIGTYAPIAGLNLLFIILPLISTINFFGIAVIDKIVNVIFLLVGLLMVKDLVATIAELIGGEDTLKSGESMASAVGGTLASVGKVAMMPARFAAAGAKMAGKTAKFAKNRIRQTRDRNAESGHVINNLDNTKEREEYGGRTQAEMFDSMSHRKQRSFLKKARLSLSEEERNDAHNEGRHNRRTYRAFRNYSLDDMRANEEAKKEKKRNKLILEGSAYNALTNHDGTFVTQEEEKKFNSYKKKGSFYRMQGMIKGKISQMSKDTKDKILDSNNTYYQNNIEGAKTWQSEKVKNFKENTIIGKVKTKQERYKNFNEAYFGKEGSTERAESERSIQTRKQEEKAVGRAFLGATGDFLGNFKDSLTSIAKTLGGEFAKGFKEGGGMGEIFAMMKGASEKDLAIAKSVKEEKKRLVSQRKAESLLGWNAKPSAPAAPSKMDISEKSAELLAKKLAETISKNLPKK